MIKIQQHAFDTVVHQMPVIQNPLKWWYAIYPVEGINIHGAQRL